MIACFSTSSPLASVCLCSEEGRVLFAQSQTAGHAAGGACLEMLRRGLEECDIELSRVSTFVADVGPGSFTGTRVGVTLAKTLAWATNAGCAGVDAFDLISPDATVVIPNKRGEWFVREAGGQVSLRETLPGKYIGFANRNEPSGTFPDASRVALVAHKLQIVEPEELVPRYLVEPSISQPKKQYGSLHGV